MALHMDNSPHTPDTLLVSACLLGEPCRYDGRSQPSSAVQALATSVAAAGGQVVPVCPEEAGGLGTPRPAAELRGGDGHAVWEGQARVVRVADGADVTEAFTRGAQASAHPNASRAILKARSPSGGCGTTPIDGQVQAGDGVFAALLRRRGASVQSDEEL